ncbi:hypothetical protein ACQKP8_27075, partial [Photobacterium alginatilyticum]
ITLGGFGMKFGALCWFGAGHLIAGVIPFQNREDYLDIFNNRELASATLIIFFLLWASYKNETVVSSFKTVAISLRQKAIVITMISLFLYTSSIVYVLYSLDVWNFGQMKNTVLWFVFVGFVQLLNTNKIKDPKLYLQTSLHAQVKLIVLVQFLVALHSYSYFVELVLVAVTSLLTCCSVFSQNKPEYNQAKKLCDFLLVATGIFYYLTHY